MRVKYLLSILLLLSIVGWGPFSLFQNHYDKVPGSETWISKDINKMAQPTELVSSKWIDKEVKVISAQANNINPAVLKLSLTAYQKARQQGLDDKELLTIIDYSKPSAERRLWVVDLKNHKVLFNTYVAHGKNSGGAVATSFSNQPSSLKSSIGVFITDDVYSGHDGYSLRIQGLEHGVNDNVYKRHVIFHGAAYVGADVAKHRGMMGRSWGCMAVSPETIRPLINTIKDKTLVFAYYPDRQWLKKSAFLT